MAHEEDCAYAGLDAAQIEAEFAAGLITPMGYHHKIGHVDNCRMGCRPLQEGEIPVEQRWRREPGG